MQDEKEGFCGAPKNLTSWGSECLPALTAEQLQEQARAFLDRQRVENPPLTKEQRADILEATRKAEQEMLDEFSFSDNYELTFLHGYLKLLRADEWDAARRMEFINALIEWAFTDHPKDAAEIRERVADEIADREAELEKLREELANMKKSIDKEFK
jgi:hypothetical protein